MSAGHTAVPNRIWRQALDFNGLRHRCQEEQKLLKTDMEAVLSHYTCMWQMLVEYQQEGCCGESQVDRGKRAVLASVTRSTKDTLQSLCEQFSSVVEVTRYWMEDAELSLKQSYEGDCLSTDTDEGSDIDDLNDDE